MSKRAIMIVTVALLLSNAMSGLDSTIVNTALPAIIADLHGLQYMAWIVASFLLGTAVSTVLWSKLGQRTSNKFAYELAALLFVLGSLLQGLAPNMAFLIAARALSGLGNGGMVSLPYIIYADLYRDPRKRMQVLGLVSGSYSMATIIGPLVGGYIVDTFSWHWVFYLNVPIGLLSAVVVQSFYQVAKNSQQRSPLDRSGAIAMVIGLVALLAGIEPIGTGSLGTIVLLLAIAAAGFGWLLFAEKRAVDPIIPGRLFKNRALVIDFALFALIWAAFMGFITYSPMWAQGLLGTSALIGGATQIPSSFANFFGSASVAPMRRRLTPYRVITIGILTLTIAFVPLVIAGVHAPYWILLVAGVFEGFGNGACFTELQVKVQTDAAAADVPVATSFSFWIRMLSQTFIAAISGIVMNHALAAGVAASAGRITMGMLNKLSDASTVGSLPQRLLPEMRTILHGGLHNIMTVSLALMLAAWALHIWSQRRARVANRTAG
ncbi:MFS transporter [Lacticaseibacillus yichunensis]|uniref:MFS transporter n=1 Tax=Lacticaseibacillus yichunensis TaxID=2486015 RepID=A0ABW4CQB2_9LACO|nr:MFS transporter [Lacticaseibacillus yichunensis]